jgi:hypothetical protein
VRSARRAVLPRQGPLIEPGLKKIVSVLSPTSPHFFPQRFFQNFFGTISRSAWVHNVSLGSHLLPAQIEPRARPCAFVHPRYHQRTGVKTHRRPFTGRGEAVAT